MKSLIFMLLFFVSNIWSSTQSITGHGNVAISGNQNRVGSVNTKLYDSEQAKEDLSRGDFRKVHFTKKEKPFSNRKKVFLLTATNYETKILHETAQELGISIKKEMVNDLIVYNLGTLGGVDVVHMQPAMMGMLEPGSTPLIIMNVFKEINPKYIVATGIAFGRQSKGHKLGDILVSSQIANYETRKEKTGDIYFRGDKATSPMLSRVNAAVHSWTGAKVHQGVILSGNVLVNSKEFLSYLEQREPEYAGGDMESYGAYAVASMMGAEWIMIKGISDWGDGTKNDDFHKIALQNATKFIFHLIKEGNLK